MSTIREKLLSKKNEEETNSTIRERLGLNNSAKTDYDNQKSKLGNVQKEYSNALREEYSKQNVNNFSLPTRLERNSFIEDLKTNSPTNTVNPFNPTENVRRIKNAQNNVSELKNKVSDEYNTLKYKRYLKDAEKVNNEDVTWFDKTIGNILRGESDLVSSLGGDKRTYIDEDGNKIYLPTYNELKQQKVSDSYDTKIGKLLGDVTYNASKILGSTAINTLAPGVGTTMYWQDMFMDNYKNTKNQGYDNTKATVYSMVNTGFEYLTGKFLGSATKGLTGGKTSELSNAISNVSNKIINNPKISSIIGSMGSEGTEEFIQEYLDNASRLLILGEDIDLTSSDILEDALYSAAVGGLSGGFIEAVDGSSANNARNNVEVYEEFKKNLEETKKTTTDVKKIQQIDSLISKVNGYIKSPFQEETKIISNINDINNRYEDIQKSNLNENSDYLDEIKTKTLEQMKEEKQDTEKVRSEVENILNERKNDNLIPYNNHEIENYKDGKVKIAKDNRDVQNFIENSKLLPSNAKLYFGKISNILADKIKKTAGINLENYNISLKADSIKHILKGHSNQNEVLRGQIPVIDSDFNLIPSIISNYDTVEQSGTTKDNKPVLTFTKQIGDKYYLVNYVSDKNHNLEVQTMWKQQKKNSATADNTQMSPIQTPEANSGTSSLYDNNISQSSDNVKLPSQYNMQQYYKNNTKKVMDPLEISRMTNENANTTPNLPKYQTVTGNKESKFYTNATENSKFLSENTRKLISNESDIKFYKVITNEETLNKAYKKLQDGGMSETLSWFNRNGYDENGKLNYKPTAEDVAEGWILMKQYEDAEDYDSVVAIAKKMREIGTQAGQTVQAFNIMERLTPEGMVKYAQSELTEAYNLMVKNKTSDWIEQNREKFELTADEVKFIMDTMKRVSKMEDGYEKKVELAQIQKVMTDKLPSTKGAKIKSWMRISMLFNPKTQVKNVAGNALIAPVNYFGDLFSSYADKIVSKKTGVRTTGNINIKAILKGMKQGAYEATNDYKLGINTKDMEGNRFEIGTGKSFNDEKIIGRNLNRVESLLNYVMDAGDRIFSQASFENSLQNQLVLNNTNKITQEMIDIAHSEALQRTWNDNNNYTQFVLSVRSMMNKLNIDGYGLGDVLIPFAKTPANLTKAIVDYSPAGLVKAIVEGNNLKKSLTNGQYNAKMQHKFVQDLGKATAGTMLYVLGYALAKSGKITGDNDDDKDVSNFLKRSLGISSYSIKIGNKSFTYDWAQPLAAPLSITANVVNSKNDGVALLEGIVGSLDTAGSILLDQSFLQSINDVLSDNDGIVSGLINEVLGLPSRAIPTFSKQIVDLTDNTQRTAYEYKNPLKTAVNNIKAKIPGLSKTLEPVIDTMGNESKRYGGKNDFFNIFLNPANINSSNLSESAKEIYDIYTKTGDKTVMPTTAPYSTKINGENVILSSNQRTKYQKLSGSIVEENVKNLMNSNVYQKMSNTDKAETIKNIVNYANNQAKIEILGAEVSNTYAKVKKYTEIGGKVSDYYLFKQHIDDSSTEAKKESISNYLINSNLSNKEISQLYSNYYSSEETLDILSNADIPIKEFIKFNLQEFESDFNSKTGKSVSGSRQKKVINYVNSLNLSIPQKALLIKMEYSSYKKYDKQIVNYINGKNLSFLDKATILKKAGFSSYDKQIISYVNELNKTVNEKQKILEDMGFTVRNGRVY